MGVLDGGSVRAPAHVDHRGVDNMGPGAAGGVNALSRPLPLRCFSDRVHVVWNRRVAQASNDSRQVSKKKIERGQGCLEESGQTGISSENGEATAMRTLMRSAKRRRSNMRPQDANSKAQLFPPLCEEGSPGVLKKTQFKRLCVC